MRTLLFTLMSLACSLALAATVYKWIDENGVIHYSDQPHPNAEKVQVQAVQTYKAPPATYTAGGGQSSAPSSGPVYRGCAVTQPVNGDSLPNPDSLTIVVQTDPPLRPGDQIFLALDGQPLNGGRPVAPQFVLSPVDRGSHALQAAVRDGDGALLCQTPSVAFEVHQPSLLNPANPVRPH
jgi:hypothetical protein